ncbi:hypothetical protein [Pseudoalteromonas sp.]|mgnify:CR=1 FL=1|uniref:hypothetical protein n=1 Tax=Pseudoalteromonas sp. TaxID=53249 RepID=UPI0025938F31|nr:hypothetical protein [Pseudoalteromonas sp.]MCP4588349.1 hypothetical protein [Pseudoalteromonas sp.]|tara:strand:- start:870 stop:1073 length:204 start_codon:yes stop_codon:yes gene_type:complete
MKKNYTVIFENGTKGKYKGFSASGAAFAASQDGKVIAVARVSKLHSAVKFLAVTTVAAAAVYQLYNL